MDNTKNILIFGGSGSIGRVLTQPFGQRGWTVGLHYYQNQSVAEETAKDIQEAGGRSILYHADVTQSSQVQEVVQAFSQNQGSLQVLIWAVGTASSDLLVKTSVENWDHILQINLSGAHNMLKAAAPIFEQQKDGAVVLVGSLSGEQGTTGQAAYAASKAGLIGLMKTVAQEWGAFNIRVNAIFPGWHRSPLSREGFPSASVGHQHLLGRTPSLNQVAEMVYHLTATTDISGQIWNLDNRMR